MNIIQHFYDDLLKNIIFDAFSNKFKEGVTKINFDGNVMGYINLLDSIDEVIADIAKNTIIITLEQMDQQYRNSIERKRKYDVKSFQPRTILTIFGEITFHRTFYVSKVNGKSFCFLDRLIGIRKYDYFDPYIKSIILEHASKFSFQKVADIVNNLIGKRISIDQKHNIISRQTVRNIILNEKLAKDKITELVTPEEIYIMADEKWIATQNNNKKKVMQKSIVVFDGIKSTSNRRELNNKRCFASIDSSFKKECLDYLYYAYDLNKIKKLFLMGDGAPWIKNMMNDFKFHNDLTISYSLDKFHYKQALRHIINEDDATEVLHLYLLQNNKEDFNRVVNEIIDLYPHRTNVKEPYKKMKKTTEFKSVVLFV